MPLVAVQFGYDGRRRTARGLVFHLQLEFVRIQSPTGNPVNVAQFEVPCRRVEITFGVGLPKLDGLEQLQHKAVRILSAGGAAGFRREIPHLIRLSVRPETKRYGQRFVFLNALPKRDVPEHIVEIKIDAPAEFFELAHLKIIVAQAQRGEVILRLGVAVAEFRVQRGLGVSPGVDAGKDLRRIAVGQTHDVLRFSKIDQRHGLPHVFFFGRGALQFPYLDVRNAFEAVRNEHLRRVLQGVLPAVAKIVGQEIVRILAVRRRFYVEFRRLGAAFYRQRVGLAFLLAGHCRQAQAAQLEFGFDAEQALSAANQAGRGGQIDVPGFNILDNFVLVPRVLQAELVLEVELILRIPINVDIEFVPDRTRDAKANVLREFRRKPPGPATNGYLLVAFPVFETGLDAGLPVYAQTHRGGAEYGAEGAASPAGYGDIESKAAPGPLAPLLGLLIADDAPGVGEPGVQAAFPVGVEVDDERVSHLAFAHKFPDDKFLSGGIQFDLVSPVVAQRGEEGAAFPLHRGGHPLVRFQGREVEVGPAKTGRVGGVVGPRFIAEDACKGDGAPDFVAENRIERNGAPGLAAEYRLEGDGVRVALGGGRIGGRVVFRGRGRNLRVAVLRRQALQQKRKRHGARRMQTGRFHAAGTLLSRYAYGVRTHPTSSR